MIRQSWPFFQNDFAGRIANRVMQTAHALRDSVMASIRAVWYIGAYGAIALTLMAVADWRLGLPTLAWFVGYVALLWFFVPRMRDLSRMSSEARSLVMARVVDSYTNILTVKLFARMADEDAYVRESIDDHGAAMQRHMRVMTRFHFLPHGDERGAARRHRGDRHLAVGARRRGRGHRRGRAAPRLAALPTSPAG